MDYARAEGQEEAKSSGSKEVQTQLLAAPRLLCCSSPPRRDWEGLSIAPAENKARGGEEGCWTGDKLGKGGESAFPEALFFFIIITNPPYSTK